MSGGRDTQSFWPAARGKRPATRRRLAVLAGVLFFVAVGRGGASAASQPPALPMSVVLDGSTQPVVLPVLPVPAPPPRDGQTIVLPPAKLTPEPVKPRVESRSALLVRFVSVLWQRARVPLFLLVLGIVFLAFLIWSVRRPGPTRWRSLTARSVVLSVIIHLMLLLSFDSLVLSQRILQTIRDPEFEVLLDSNSLAEEKVSLGIREEAAELPLANAATAVAVAPKEAELPLSEMAPVEQPSVVAPARLEATAFQLPVDIVEPKPVAKEEPATPLAARPSSDFRVLLPQVTFETPKLPTLPEHERPSAATAAIAPQKIEQPLAGGPAIASGPVGAATSATAPSLGPAAPLTASLAAFPAPPGVSRGAPIEPAPPPRVLVPRPSPRPVPPPFVLEERPVSDESYKLRPPEQRAKVLERLGGTTETEETVRLALKWLAAHQSEDGRWAVAGFDVKCGQCGGQGEYGKQDVAATGLAVLAFLGANHSHKAEGPYRETVARAIKWLTDQARENGDLRGQGNMYDQGMGTMALAEACGMTRDPSLRLVVTRAAQFIAAAQNRETGGWRYFPGEEGDTSVFGWQVMALVSATRAGVPVPQEALKLSERWLERVGGGEHGGLCGYQGKTPTMAMAAEGMFSRQLLGRSPTDPMMVEAADYLRTHLPEASEPNMYYWYYGTLALFQHQGPAWEDWNRAMRKALLLRQEKSGTRNGSWPPAGQWGKQGGRVIETAMAALSLEVYYRYLPLYAPLPTTAVSKPAAVSTGPPGGTSRDTKKSTKPAASKKAPSPSTKTPKQKPK